MENSEILADLEWYGIKISMSLGKKSITDF